YYQPEAYVVHKDLYIEKDADINREIERLRHFATKSLLTRKDVIIVATVSCIFGLGSPDEYLAKLLRVRVAEKSSPQDIVRKLVTMRYERNDLAQTSGKFRLKGDVLEVTGSDSNLITRIEFFGAEVEKIQEIDPLDRSVIRDLDETLFFPNTHYVLPEQRYDNILKEIEKDMKDRVKWFKSQNRLVEAQRLEQRVKYDLEMIAETGYVKGIENYSRYFSGRQPGEPPGCLIDYFPKEYFTVVDESHVTIPQIGGMYGGDRTRKESLVEYGFRLPAALDNRPLTFEEWWERTDRILFMSATPAVFEIQKSRQVAEQIIRPTGLVDPGAEVRPASGQIKDLLKEIEDRVKKHERTLVIALTKKTAEDISYFLKEKGFRGEYIHSEIDALERVKLLRNLRQGKIDVLVGINLLREGLDLPEVTLVAILDADKEGFLRSDTSLIQIMGRASRNVEGRVILYADNPTGSMARALEEARRRRTIQVAYNEEHGITPKSIVKEIRKQSILMADEDDILKTKNPKKVRAYMTDLEDQMMKAAEKLEFEYAAVLRDKISILAESLEEYDPSPTPTSGADV
ncbi:MAG: excinuclease ABC subunit UvrB, partial [bacterium]